MSNGVALQEALLRCSQEQIQFAGAIQSYGVMIAIDDDGVIRMTSANVHDFLGREAADVIGKNVSEILGEDIAQNLLNAKIYEELQPSIPVTIRYSRDGKRLVSAALAHRSGGLRVFEIEPAITEDSGDKQSFLEQLFLPVRDALWRFDQEEDVVRYCRYVAEEVRRITGFDRIKIYRFDHLWNGEVIAESRNERLPSLLGNHFPASDIPPQARALYEKNLIRVLVDTQAQPVPTIPAYNPLTQKPLDMSFSVLRAMSPIHIEYLRNMGVRSSITVSLMQNKRLWGLIACHNADSRLVPFQLRELAEFIGKSVSLKLSNLEATARSDYMNQVRETLITLTRLIRATGEVDSVISMFENEILGLVGASGSVINLGKHSYVVGQTPDRADVQCLTTWLKDVNQSGEVYATDCLGEVFEPARKYAERASGLLAVPLDPEFRDYMLWFRAEVTQEIPWAGNPNKQLVEDEDGPRIEPRRSFAIWLQTAHGHSKPWSHIETDAALALSLTLVEVLTQKALRLSEENYRLLAEHSTDLISRHKITGEFAFISPSSSELLGYSPEFLLAKSLFDFIHAEDLPDVQNKFAISARGQSNQVVTYRVRASSGAYVWLESTIKPVAIASHGNVEFVINSRDVTERHEYQQVIENIQQRNSAILQAAGEGVIGLDSEGNVSFANLTAGELLGCQPSAIIGKHYCDVLGCCQVIQTDPANCRIGKCLEKGEPYQESGGSFCRCDSAFPVDFIATPIRSDDKIDGAVIVFRDISEQKLIDDKLRQSNSVFENTVEGIMVTNAAGEILAVNKAFSDITGYTQDEVLGKTPSFLKSGRHSPEFYREMWKQVIESKSWRGEIWNRRKNGEIFPQWGSITSVLDEKGDIRNFVTVFSDISKAKRIEEQLQFLANHDPLTKLPNRNLLKERLRQQLEDAYANKRKLAVAFIDLDHFKEINDTLGHAVGDDFLIEISHRLTQAVRRSDTLARWGGDEFVVVFNDVKEVERLADRAYNILRSIGQPLQLGQQSLTPSASIGIAVYPDDGNDFVKLVQAADTAMYRAKKQGRNRFEFFTQELTDEAQQRFQMGWELRRALANDEFVLHYQPQCDAISGHILGLEALIRWNHPERGLLAPASFLPLCEELGLISELGKWVIVQVCRQIVPWESVLPPGVRVAVNIAPQQITPTLIPYVHEVLTETGISPARLEFEITEGALERRDNVRHILAELREMGIAVSIDDFGTGYSSLAHLTELTVDCFKIDKSFVDGLPDGKNAGAIIRTIVALGSSLGIKIVAEGVEKAEQLAFLRAEGVVTIQGYYFSRPLPREAAEHFIQSRMQADGS